MFVETINTIGTLVNAYEIGKKSQPLLGKLIRRIRDRKLNIVICGAAGTGKSTLGKLLCGEFYREDVLQPYQISLRPEVMELEGSANCSILILPGQPTFWNESLRKIANNQVSLILNVVSYGYHSIGRVDDQNLPSHRQGTTQKEFLDTYLKEQRKLEIELLDRLVPRSFKVYKK